MWGRPPRPSGKGEAEPFTHDPERVITLSGELLSEAKKTRSRRIPTGATSVSVRDSARLAHQLSHIRPLCDP
jgi:hypothetical protein